MKKDLLWANFVVKLLKLKEENLMLYLAVSNCIINNSERFYVCISKNWKKYSKWYSKKNSQGPQYCFKILCTLGLDEFFFSKSLKEDPQLIFFLQKLIVHILWTSKTISYFTSSENVHVVHCKTIISSLNYSASHLLCGMNMAIFLLWAKPWIFSILFLFSWKRKTKEGLK